jgi:hypothetical protein
MNMLVFTGNDHMYCDEVLNAFSRLLPRPRNISFLCSNFRLTLLKLMRRSPATRPAVATPRTSHMQVNETVALSPTGQDQPIKATGATLLKHSLSLLHAVILLVLQ